MRRLLLVLTLLMAFAVSFAAVFFLGGDSTTPSRNVPLPAQGSIDLMERFDDPSILSAAMTAGWGKQEPWGVWISGRQATVTLEPEARAREDVNLVFEGRGPEPGRAARLLRVLVNGTFVGEVELAAQRGDIARRLLIPQDALNRRWPPQITFELDQVDARGFGLRRVVLSDAARFRQARGFVDGCDQAKVFGWAMADDLATPVIIVANGERLAGRLRIVDRADLAAERLPRDAGFELTFSKPLPKGTDVHVTLPGGRTLEHSPCRI